MIIINLTFVNMEIIGGGGGDGWVGEWIIVCVVTCFSGCIFYMVPSFMC